MGNKPPKMENKINLKFVKKKKKKENVGDVLFFFFLRESYSNCSVMRITKRNLRNGNASGTVVWPETLD
ncbi:Uncharacterized protein APZ42_023071 [Daphnia magna]|uniref:Uncharacterized protein n=1 Tax=Daphnia magna TaxID=35525 RepID=A0A162DI48_9CRUS|nr:Uncharacterized protein APZ42_023071 [Daphnia magna]